MDLFRTTDSQLNSMMKKWFTFWLKLKCSRWKMLINRFWKINGKINKWHLVLNTNSTHKTFIDLPKARTKKCLFLSLSPFNPSQTKFDTLIIDFGYYIGKNKNSIDIKHSNNKNTERLKWMINKIDRKRDSIGSFVSYLYVVYGLLHRKH